MIRSSMPGLDETFCAIQGFAAACAINTIRGMTVYSPYNAAVCFAGVALIEKLTHEISKRTIPGSTAFLGPIPCGTQNVVSYGFAIYTTLKIMKLAGLILNIPQAVTIIGLTCASALALSLVRQISKSSSITLKTQLESKVFANVLYTLKHENKNYIIRVIWNPEQRRIIFFGNGIVLLNSSDSCILACNENIPKALLEGFEELAGKPTVLSAKINGINPLDYTAKPIIT